jgi:hypothetical protein
MSDKRPRILDEYPDFEGWEVKQPKDADKIARDTRFGKIYRDPKQKIGNKRIWWSQDRAEHGGSKYKLFVERSDHLELVADIDKDGNAIPKWKSEVGTKIYKKDLIGVR